MSFPSIPFQNRCQVPIYVICIVRKKWTVKIHILTMPISEFKIKQMYYLPKQYAMSQLFGRDKLYKKNVPHFRICTAYCSLHLSAPTCRQAFLVTIVPSDVGWEPTICSEISRFFFHMFNQSLPSIQDSQVQVTQLL